MVHVARPAACSGALRCAACMAHHGATEQRDRTPRPDTAWCTRVRPGRLARHLRRRALAAAAACKQREPWQRAARPGRPGHQARPPPRRSAHRIWPGTLMRPGRGAWRVAVPSGGSAPGVSQISPPLGCARRPAALCCSRAASGRHLCFLTQLARRCALVCARAGRGSHRSHGALFDQGFPDGPVG